MNKITRRDFLKIAGAASGASALAYFSVPLAYDETAVASDVPANAIVETGTGFPIVETGTGLYIVES